MLILPSVNLLLSFSRTGYNSSEYPNTSVYALLKNGKPLFMERSLAEEPKIFSHTSLFLARLPPPFLFMNRREIGASGPNPPL